jgi:hypothetical protein
LLKEKIMQVQSLSEPFKAAETRTENAALNPITRENFGRFQIGMSRAEVEAILGPPGDYRTGPTTHADPGSWQIVVDGRMQDLRLFTWQADSAIVAVWFGQSDISEWKAFQPTARLPEPSVTETFLARVKRYWHRVGFANPPGIARTSDGRVWIGASAAG